LLRLRKVVIPAAGLGTRLLPATKAQPKEMLPLFVHVGGRTMLKPLLHVVFERLYGEGFREFCFITGRGKRAIEDYFTIDRGMVESLGKNGQGVVARELERFHTMVDKSQIMWMNQPEPRGFGDAVYRSYPFTGDEPFLLHNGDTYIHSKRDYCVRMLKEVHERYNSEVTFLLERVKDPRNYGVVEGVPVGRRIFKVQRIEEKPSRPRSNMAVAGVYVLNPSIMKALRKVKVEEGREKQLTDAIELLAEGGANVYGVELQRGETHIDIGDAERYWAALEATSVRWRQS